MPILQGYRKQLCITPATDKEKEEGGAFLLHFLP